jgi:MYXO-CTERM domain-containing protein
MVARFAVALTCLLFSTLAEAREGGRPAAFLGKFTGKGGSEMRGQARRALARAIDLVEAPAGVPTIEGKVIQRRNGTGALVLRVVDDQGAPRGQRTLSFDDPRIYDTMTELAVQLVRQASPAAREPEPPAATPPAQPAGARPRAFLSPVTGPRGSEMEPSLRKALSRRVELTPTAGDVPTIEGGLVSMEGGWTLRLAVFDAAGQPVASRLYKLDDPRLYNRATADMAELVSRAAARPAPARAAAPEPRPEPPRSRFVPERRPAASPPAEPAPAPAEPDRPPPALSRPPAPVAPPEPPPKPEPPSKPLPVAGSAEDVAEEPPELRRKAPPPTKRGCACQLGASRGAPAGWPLAVLGLLAAAHLRRRSRR